MERQMKEELVRYIVARIEEDFDSLKADFDRDKGVTAKSVAIDNLLPAAIAHKIALAFPEPSEMRLLASFREKKRTSKSLDDFDPLIRDITFAFQDGRVVDLVSRLTGIRDAHGDPQLYAGGISAMSKGHFLNPHLDNSHDHEQRNYRVLNLLYYCTPDWKRENGGNLELWDEDVREPLEIPSLFNRLVLMETNDRSYHSVNKVCVDGIRKCVSNYYFSPHSPNPYETSHVTYFKARPEQRLMRFITDFDSRVRTAARSFFKKGFAKKDLYRD
jgi:Rps23 Pro-64 3,4-dihydroxylase Tpa1-like proline 4-hydroxylase